MGKRCRAPHSKAAAAARNSQLSDHVRQPVRHPPVREEAAQCIAVIPRDHSLSAARRDALECGALRRFSFTVAAAVPRILSLNRRHSIGRAWERPKGIVGLAPSSGYAAALAGARFPLPFHHGFAPVATICRPLRGLGSFLPESQLAAPDLPQTCSIAGIKQASQAKGKVTGRRVA